MAYPAGGATAFILLPLPWHPPDHAVRHVTHKAQNSADFAATRPVRDDMGASARVQRVPWHPAQPADNAPISGAAPVRTVHYIFGP